MSKKTVIVTGASTGIGNGIARLFLDKGHNVVLNSVHADNLNRAYADFGSPASAIVVAGDVQHKTVGKQLVDAAVERFGALDIVINNAGVFAPKPFLDVEEGDLDTFWNVNLKGTFFTTQAAIAHMKNNGGGAIINIGTVLVDHAIAGMPATAPIVSKGGIHALTKQLAAEFANDNIRVNTVAPGIIRSALQGKLGIADVDSLAKLHLLHRVGEPRDIAEMVYSIALNNFVTGAIINVDGGHVAGHSFN